MSRVFPEPTGPAMPMRSASGIDLSDPGAGEAGAAVEGLEIVSP